MNLIRNNKTVKEQYKNAKNLQTRISIHEKYSVNRQGFGNWIFEQYQIIDGMRILELGCGEGSMWKTNLEKLPTHISLVLTDFSEGMLLEAKKNLPDSKIISYQNVDIQNIPYDNSCFDMVIANMMLYHVPNLERGLKEVRRVLKENGIFYCATYGENGITQYLQELLSDYGIQNKINKAFTLQNGEKQLQKYFRSIKKYIYKDHLEVTETEDLLDYISSLTFMTELNKIPKSVIEARLNSKKENNVIKIPKEYGMFVMGK